jgi:hypothetical protein
LSVIESNAQVSTAGSHQRQDQVQAITNAAAAAAASLDFTASARYAAAHHAWLCLHWAVPAQTSAVEASFRTCHIRTEGSVRPAFEVKAAAVWMNAAA